MREPSMEKALASSLRAGRAAFPLRLSWPVGSLKLHWAPRAIAESPCRHHTQAQSCQACSGWADLAEYQQAAPRAAAALQLDDL